MRQQLEAALNTVPILAHLGLAVEEARAGRVLMRLPLKRSNTNALGDLHGGTQMILAETAAGVAAGTHPELAEFLHLQKGTHVHYVQPARTDVTAEVRITSDFIAAVREGVARNGKARMEVPVPILDGKGRELSLITVVFSFRPKPGSRPTEAG